MKVFPLDHLFAKRNKIFLSRQIKEFDSSMTKNRVSIDLPTQSLASTLKDNTISRFLNLSNFFGKLIEVESGNNSKFKGDR